MEYSLAFFQTLLVSVPGWLLWLGASVGHGFFWLVAINVFYAINVPHQIQDIFRKLDALLILGGPVLFIFALPNGNDHSLTAAVGPPWFFAPYLFFCFLMGVVVAPISQVRYWTRSQAPQVVGKTFEVVDFEKELGYPPSGTGKEAAMTRLPGNQVFQVEFVDLHLCLPQLPAAWEGLTILHLTDLHFHAGLERKFFQAVMDRCLQWGTPDLLCITGDVVDSAWHHRWIMPVLGRLRWQAAGLFILGNHDVWWQPELIRRRLGRIGLQNVGNTWKQIDVRGQPLIVIGHEGPWIQPIPTLANCPEDIFRLCLSHSPDAISWARKHRVDLMLAGHVHGGQIRVPPLGSLFVPSRHSRKYDAGTFFVEPTVMHVGRGLSGKQPLRFNCRPEVTRLVLTKGIGQGS